MNSFKTLLTLSAISAAGSQVARADTSFILDTNQTYRQYSSNEISFLGGDATIELQDGTALIRGGCGSTAQTNPDVGPCVPGTNTYFYPIPNGTGGFTDGLGANRYQIVDQLEPAAAVDPALPDRIVLRTVPPYSTFRIPEDSFVDNSIIVLGTRVGNTAVPYGREFRLAGYLYSKEYGAGERGTFDSDWRFRSNYQVDFPRLGSAINPNLPPIRLSAQHYPHVDGYRKVNSQWVGFRFTDLPEFVDGFIRVDPRVNFVLRWQIVGGSPVLPSADILYFNMLNLGPNQEDPTADPTGIYFPNYNQGDEELDNEGADRIQLTSPTLNAYVFPLGVPQAGQRVLANLTYSRALQLDGTAWDTGDRSFQVPIRFENSASGGIAVAFPMNTPDSTLDFDADPDGDGFTNFEEWAMGSNPNSKSSVPSGGSISPTAPSSLVRDGSASNGWKIEFTKVPYADYRVVYTVEVSEDMKTWSPITSSNENWQVSNVESSDKLIVTSKGNSSPSGSFFRMKASFNK